MDRRQFLAAAAALATTQTVRAAEPRERREPIESVYERLDAAAARPVLRTDLFPSPVRIASVELLRSPNGFHYVCRVRSTDGGEGLCLGHSWRMRYLHPIQTQQVQPFFVGKDARDLDALIDGVYLANNNYKLQNMALWIPVATVELAILDLLGNMAGRPMGELVSETLHRDRISVYRANNLRGKSAAESVEIMRDRVRQTGAKAIKIKIGGRMRATEQPPGRTERLIPLVRESFGDEMTLFADANGAYDAAEAVRIGRVLQEHRYSLFEAPVPFDWYEDILRVGQSLDIRTAGGGQEPSLRNFRWLIAHGGFDVYQQDLFYFGGMVRCIRVARMAAAAGYEVMPHISNTGLGFLYMLHFVSAIPNAARFHELKDLDDGIPVTGDRDVPLRPANGKMPVPTGAGDGVTIDPGWLAAFRPVTA